MSDIVPLHHHQKENLRNIDPHPAHPRDRLRVEVNHLTMRINLPRDVIDHRRVREKSLQKIIIDRLPVQEKDQKSVIDHLLALEKDPTKSVIVHLLVLEKDTDRLRKKDPLQDAIDQTPEKDHPGEDMTLEVLPSIPKDVDHQNIREETSLPKKGLVQENQVNIIVRGINLFFYKINFLFV